MQPGADLGFSRGGSGFSKNPFSKPFFSSFKLIIAPKVAPNIGTKSYIGTKSTFRKFEGGQPEMDVVKSYQRGALVGEGVEERVCLKSPNPPPPPPPTKKNVHASTKKIENMKRNQQGF